MFEKIYRHFYAYSIAPFAENPLICHDHFRQHQNEIIAYVHLGDFRLKLILNFYTNHIVINENDLENF
ncbi:hypothetical protein CO704_25940 (plasmid) [Cedecea neteri]|uniref:Uncharacterized protein n=1 Tax=Cedecea neteri TaxID=158822 RepID=A0A291E6G2_9ENTR|nr:hypothetical protein CO704_25940 [Cedecea neteri]